MHVKGFTLLEMLISLVIFSIIVSLAVPSFKETVKNNRLRSAANNTYSLIQFARAEAVRKWGIVHVSAIDNKDWSNGAMVWLDVNGDHKFDDRIKINGEKVEYPDIELRRTVQKNPVDVLEKSALTVIWFTRKGYLETGKINSSDLTLGFCDSRPEETGRQVRVLRSGISAVSMKDDCKTVKI